MDAYVKKIGLPIGIAAIIVAAIIAAIVMQGGHVLPVKTSGGMMGGIGGGGNQPTTGAIVNPTPTPAPGQNRVKDIWSRDELMVEIPQGTQEEIFPQMPTIYDDGILVIKTAFYRDGSSGGTMVKNIGTASVDALITIERLDLSPAEQEDHPEGIKYTSHGVLKPGRVGDIDMLGGGPKKFKISVQYLK